MSTNNSNNNTSGSSGSRTLQNIAKSLDAILDKPADDWSQKEINIYHLLQSTLDKYKIRYSLAQFKLDVRDIKKNVKTCKWYKRSDYKKVLNWCMDQLVIKSYSHSTKSGNFKLVARLSQACVRIEIVKAEKFHYKVESEKLNIVTKDLTDLDNMTPIFGINPTASMEQRMEVVSEIGALITEIGMFYS